MFRHNGKWLVLLFVSLTWGCGISLNTTEPTELWFKDGSTLRCERGYTSAEPHVGGKGRCFHRDGTITVFTWLGNTQSVPLKLAEETRMGDNRVPPRYSSTPDSAKEAWKFMDKFDALIAKIEGMFEKWLGDFEAHPFTTGFKALFAFLLIRFVYRKLLR